MFDAASWLRSALQCPCCVGCASGKQLTAADFIGLLAAFGAWVFWEGVRAIVLIASFGGLLFALGRVVTGQMN